jgi:hypothetical protein
VLSESDAQGEVRLDRLLAITPLDAGAVFGHAVLTDSKKKLFWA